LAIASVLLVCAPAPPVDGAQSATVAAGPVTAHARLELPAPGGPRGITLADVDGDKIAELLAVSEEPGGLLIWSGLVPALCVLPAPHVIPLKDHALGPFAMGPSDAASARFAFGLRGAAAIECVDIDLGLDGGVGRRERVALPSAPRAMAAVGDAWGQPGLGCVRGATAAGELLVVDLEGVRSTVTIADGLPPRSARGAGRRGGHRAKRSVDNVPRPARRAVG